MGTEKRDKNVNDGGVKVERGVGKKKRPVIEKEMRRRKEKEGRERINEREGGRVREGRGRGANR